MLATTYRSVLGNAVAAVTVVLFTCCMHDSIVMMHCGGFGAAVVTRA